MSDNQNKYYFFRFSTADAGGDEGNGLDFTTMMRAVLGGSDADVSGRLEELRPEVKKLQGHILTRIELSDNESEEMGTYNRIRRNKDDQEASSYRPNIAEDAPEWMQILARYSGEPADDQEVTAKISGEIEQARYYQEIFEDLNLKNSEEIKVLQNDPKQWAEFMSKHSLPQTVDKDSPSCMIVPEKIQVEQEIYNEEKNELTLLNVNDSGLNLLIKNGNAGVISSKGDELSGEQFEALVKYLAASKIKIDDFGGLKDLKVRYNPNPELEIVNGKEERKPYFSESYETKPLDFALADYLRHGNAEYEKYLEENYSDYYHRNDAELNNAEGQREATVPNSDGQEGENAPAEDGSTTEIFGDIPDNSYGVCGYLKNKPILANNHNNRKMAREKGREKLDEGLGLMVISDSVDWGGHTVRIWASEADRVKDGEIDSKKGTKANTKQALYRVTNSRPPEARVYLGKLSPNEYSKLTVPILKEFAALGYTSFVMPKAKDLTKPLFKAYLDAAINTGVVPCLKSAQHPDGMDMSYGDIADLMDIWKEKTKGKDMDKKIEFALRFSEQIHNFTGEDRDKVATFGEQLRMQAIFMKFTNSSLDSLREHMAKKVDDGSWGDVDAIAAKAALTRIVEELQKGTLGGKPYNPLTNNTEEIIRVFDKYQQNPELQNKIVNEINAQKSSSTRENQADPRRNQVSAVENQYSDRFKKLTEGLKGYGVEISDVCPRVTKSDKNGYRQRPAPSQGRQ